MIEETQRTIKIQSKSTSLSKTKSMKRSRRTPEYGTLLTMQDIPKKLLDTINHPSYRPLKPKALSRKVGLAKRYDEFKAALKELIKTGQVKLDKNHSIRPVGGDVKNAIPGIFRKTGSGIGFVRPSTVAATGAKPEEIFISEHAQLDASTGDTVLVRGTKVFVNGKRLLSEGGYVTSYHDHTLGPKQAALFQEGMNTIAVICTQTGGGQGIDLGLTIQPNEE